MDNFEYSIPVTELDEIIEKMNMGIEPFISDMVRKDVELRKKELMAQILDEDIDDVDMEEYNRHRQEIKAHQEAQKRKATREERGAYITLSREKYAKLLDDMETTYVEYNPDCPYHLSDDALNSDAEYIILKQKMSKLKNCYYNQHDWVNAVNIIMQMTQYECTHDYMWLGYIGKKGIEAFNDGSIKINPGILPKLFIDFTKELKDPKILADIMKGNTTVIANDTTTNNRSIINKHKQGKPIYYTYDNVSGNEYGLFNEMKQHGVDTPINPIIDYSSGMFNRTNLMKTSPILSMFNKPNKKNDEIALGNFLSENGGMNKYNADNNININTVDVIKEFNKDNNNKFNKSAIDGVQEYMSSFKNVNTEIKQNIRDTDDIINNTSNEEVLKVEQGILEAIRYMNPDIK